MVYLTCDLIFLPWLAAAMDYTVYVPSLALVAQVCFLLECRHTETVTDTSDHPSHTSATAGVDNEKFRDTGGLIQTIMAFTMSFWLFFNARTALARDTLACDITSSTSFASIPLSSTYKQGTVDRSTDSLKFN